jgi:rhamnosyltransferase
VEADFLIASGSLIPVAALDRVGPMREDLFIDYVDVEWCLRARREGLRCYGVFEATMEHRLGESRVRVFGREATARSPLRHYYLMRNALLLYRESWVPLNWKLVDAGRLLLKFGFYSLAAPPRLQHVRMMARGLWHGLTGRAGPLA